MEQHDMSLKVQDPEIHKLAVEEWDRQQSGLELIASENFTSAAVMQALATCFTNKYSEGLPGSRYYGGNEVIDRVERLTQQRCLEAFGLDAQHWGVNVQPYSGSSANFEAYNALLKPHQRIMGLDLPSGGHLTHGYQTATKKVSATSIYFESMPYQVSPETGYLDLDQLATNARLFHPNLIIVGASAYPRDFDYKRFREIADEHHAYLLCDMAHIAGIVAAKECNSPFEWCDVVTTTTHKTLRGPRAGLIFFRRGPKIVSYSPLQYSSSEVYDLEAKVNGSVFPALQGGPHENTIAAVAVAMKEVASLEFKRYIRQVKLNAKALAESLKALGYCLVTGGTDNHLLLWDLRPHGITGSKMEKLYDKICISVNKNTVHGDVSAFSPGGVRLGTPALTTRGLVEKDFEFIATFLDRGVKIALRIQNTVGKKLSDFEAALKEDPELTQLKQDVQTYARQFKLPGIRQL
ncbi:serine hydroxymethyltransferase 2-like [Schistocerca gregaria]|uniref:serine hydroxymethyltransferase 2-like n=1 Tax=Schistocerca gregaria TaxID=7010 RepID=UPI00211DA525|nr:serine hydroxymethyltransferase 2-like [Schistocerca gregaria]